MHFTDVLLTDSDEELDRDRDDQPTNQACADGDDSQGECSGLEDADGEPDTWEQGSQASTIIEDPSDCEDFATEHGVPAALTEGLIDPL
jgi:hypothetical protein